MSILYLVQDISPGHSFHSYLPSSLHDRGYFFYTIRFILKPELCQVFNSHLPFVDLKLVIIENYLTVQECLMSSFHSVFRWNISYTNFLLFPLNYYNCPPNILIGPLHKGERNFHFVIPPRFQGSTFSGYRVTPTKSRILFLMSRMGVGADR